MTNHVSSSKLGWDKRRFGKETYTFCTYKHTKPEAQHQAKLERKKGWKVRVFKRKIGIKTYYDLYLRGK